jgi:hypothetical protein
MFESNIFPITNKNGWFDNITEQNLIRRIILAINNYEPETIQSLIEDVSIEYNYNSKYLESELLKFAKLRLFFVDTLGKINYDYRLVIFQRELRMAIANSQYRF